MAKQQDWKTRPVDATFLLESGLLFEINRTVLHLVGVALTVAIDKETGRSRLTLKDSRESPEQLVFDKAGYEAGMLRLRSFMDSFGGSQVERRRKALGWGYQPCGKVK